MPVSVVEVYDSVSRNAQIKKLPLTSIGLAYGIVHQLPVVFRDVVDSLVQRKEVLTNLRALALSAVGQSVIGMTILSADQESKPPFDRTNMQLGMYINALLDVPILASGYYLQQIDMKEILPSLLIDASICSYGPCALLSAINPRYCHEPTFYIGKAGTKTSLHYDRSSSEYAYSAHHSSDPGKHNVFLQISGARKFYLFQPTNAYSYDSGYSGEYDFDSMLPSEGSAGPHISQSTTFLHTVPEGTEHEQIQYILNSEFPSLVHAWKNRLEIILNAGHALFIPAKTWHFTRIVESGVALNWWFATESCEQLPQTRVIDGLANDNWIE